jgi:hypothetical protein
MKNVPKRTKKASTHKTKVEDEIQKQWHNLTYSDGVQYYYSDGTPMKVLRRGYYTEFGRYIGDHAPGVDLGTYGSSS